MGKLTESDKHESESKALSPSPPPPQYLQEDPPDITLGFANITLDENNYARSPRPSPDQCIAHLKLLEAFSQLRERIGTTDGLYGLSDSLVLDRKAKDDLIHEQSQKDELMSKMREKRWAVYVTQAVLRFETYFKCVRPEAKRMVEPSMFLNYEKVIDKGRPIQFTADTLPPLDILMVYHSFMLNPRNFLADCVRYGMMDLWVTGFPWALVAAAIDNESFEYRPSENAKKFFEVQTGRPWNILEEPEHLILDCYRCSGKIKVKLSNADEEMYWTWDDRGKGGKGYADATLSAVCSHCGTLTNHEMLRCLHFLRDLEALKEDEVPMCGTLLNINGMPETAHKTLLTRRQGTYGTAFPNHLLKGKENVRLGTSTDPKIRTMQDVRDCIETAIEVTSLSRSMKSGGKRMTRDEKIAIRRMMSCYWENSSIFSMDLVGAVIRQGTFVQKMHGIDWLHSPSLRNTMQRLLVKYERFFEIMATYPMNVAVPTLDVDLAWHTHQLNPRAYYQYSVDKTKKFIDHDDKIEENKLSESFEWTCKTYEKRYKEVYAECTCWYCESIRESFTSSASRLFRSKNSPINQDLDRLHSTPDLSDPLKGPHISAHNAIKAENNPNKNVVEYVQKYQLERNFLKARRRAEKEGRKPPERTNYVYADAYGYPMYYYAYPYVPYGDPCISSGMYVSNPTCANFAPSAAGNCCSGTCGGGVAFGACAGGGCGSGVGGGCGGGGGGGGGCAGGGGGGCGGGGGGCGGGGGG